MVDTHKCLAMLCSVLVWLGSGCGDDGSGNEQPNGAAGSATGGGGASADAGTSTSGEGGGGAAATSGQGGGGTTGGSAGAQEQTPPPEMPRELGPPDGIYCESAFDPPTETCPAGSRCCPNGLGGRIEQVCVDGSQCPACDGTSCGELLCDGPEDCGGGEFCCYTRHGICRNSPEACVPANTLAEEASWRSVECRARCVGDQDDPDHGTVVCQDDRDCPGPYVAGRCRPLDVSAVPFGLKACLD